jgi:hypothetical protein
VPGSGAPGAPLEDPEDSPAALAASIGSLVRFVNSSGGQLPVAAVVAARRITDLLDEEVDTAQVRPLDIQAVISVRAIATDYLPTTLRSYLALDPALRETPRPGRSTPTAALLEQLAELEGAALSVLEATQQQDVDALTTQGSFLRTKFSRSDLDL